MKTQKKRYSCDHKGCDFSSDFPQGLGRHKLSIHGINGTARKSGKKIVKRKYNKRSKKVEGDQSVNFCPCCGANIRGVSLAMTLGRITQ